MNDLVRYTAAPLDERVEYAKTLAGAGTLIPSSLRDGSNPAPGKVFLALEMGAMLDLHPLAALSGIHVIEGKPSMGVGLMAAVVRRAGHRLRIATTGTWAGGDYEAVATLIRSDDPEHEYRVTWNADRARQANLLGRGNWRTYPEAMCEARAISAVCRQGAPDALMGVAYTTEELGGEVDENAEPAAAPVDETAPSALPAKRKRATNGAQGTRRRPKAAEEPEVTGEDVIDAEVVEESETPPEALAAAPVAAEDVPEPQEPAEPSLTAEEQAQEAEIAEREERARIAEEQERRAREEADAADAETPSEPAPAGDDWEGLVSAARDSKDALRSVWMDADAAGALSSDLRRSIIALVDRIDHPEKYADEQPEDDRPMALGDGS